jgi:ribosomal protein S18 acetylase RimI-like enzyme
MIKIGTLLSSEYKQASMLLALQAAVTQEVADVNDGELLLDGLAFWQHWLPCQLHLTRSMYVAREEGQLLGIIALNHTSKVRTCWQVTNLVVHPDHRGRGIAQELLRYVFAQFGSQGVMHFLAEVSACNEAALGLFANCGFCRSARITYYRFDEAKAEKTRLLPSDRFKLAPPHLKPALCQLHSDVLPPALRQVLLLSPDDFSANDLVAFTSVEKSQQKLMRKRVWHWVCADTERMVLSASVRVSAEPQSGYKLEFAVHQGWKHLEEELVHFALSSLLSEAPRAKILAKIYDFQGDMHALMQSCGFERSGEAFLLLREHWQRQRRTKRATIPQIGKPAIHFPMAAE